MKLHIYIRIYVDIDIDICVYIYRHRYTNTFLHGTWTVRPVAAVAATLQPGPAQFLPQACRPWLGGIISSRKTSGPDFRPAGGQATSVLLGNVPYGLITFTVENVHLNFQFEFVQPQLQAAGSHKCPFLPD